MADNRLENLKKLSDAQERYQKLLDMQEKSGKDYSASLEKQQEKVKTLADELKKVNASNQSFVGELERGVSSIATQFGTFKDLQTQVVSESKSIANLNQVQKDAITNILEETRSLSNLNAEDVEQIAAKNEALNKQLEVAASILGADSEILKTLVKIKGEANGIASLSKEEKDAIDLQQQASEKLKQSFQAITETVQTTLMKLLSVRGAMGGLLYAGGAFLGKLGEVNKELGQVGEGLSGAAGNAAVMSFFFNDAAGNLKALSAEMGGMEQASFRNQANINLMANNLGISGGEAVKLQGALSRLNGGSLDTAANLTDGARSFARMNNIPVSQLMSDVAGATEEFALFGKDGGKNILQAAGYAAKLGTNMGTISKIADGLLDFESSITKELELGAMLGRNINLNKARQLAYDGDLEGMTKEALKQLGGINEFNRMDVFQKKQAAAALGVSVSELNKMVSNQEQANAISKMQVGNFDSLVEGSKALAAQFGPKLMKSMGTFLMLSSQANQSFQLMGKAKIGSKVGKMFEMAKTKIGSKIGKMSGMSKGPSDVMSNAKTSTDVSNKMGKPKGSPLKTLSSGLKSMGNKKVLFGALNLIPTALGFVAMIPAIPGMIATSILGGPTGTALSALAVGIRGMGSKRALLGTLGLIGAGVGFAAMTLGIPGMIGVALLGGPASVGLGLLSVGLTSFGTAAMNPLLWVGIGAIAALGLALLPVAGALAIASPAISAFGDVLLGAFNGIASIVTAVAGGLIGMLEVITIEKAVAMGVLGASFGLMALGIGSLALAAGLGGGVVRRFLRKTGESIGAIGESGVQNVQNLASALQGMATGLSAVVTQLDRLDTEKLEKLSEVSISASIGGAISGIGDSIGGLIDTVSGVVGGESLSEYESTMISKMEQLIAATSANKDVYLDREKVTSLVMDTGDRSVVNKFSLNNG